MRVRVTAHFLVLAFVGCATPKVPAKDPMAATTTPKAEPKTESAPPATTPVKSSPTAVKVELVKAGQEPRVLLRIKLAPKQNHVVTTETKTWVNTQVNGQKVAQGQWPTVLQTIAYQATQVDNEQFTLNWTLNMKAQGGPDIDPQAVEKMNTQLAALQDLKGTVRYNARGQLQEISAAQSDEDTQRIIAEAWVPFPEEPVGVGGQWKTTREHTVNGFAASTETTFTVTQIKGDLVTTTATSVTKGKPGPFNHPELPPETTIELKSMQGQNKIEATIQNNAFFSATSQKSGDMKSVLLMQAQGNSQEIHTDTKTTVTIKNAGA